MLECFTVVAPPIFLEDHELNKIDSALYNSCKSELLWYCGSWEENIMILPYFCTFVIISPLKKTCMALSLNNLEFPLPKDDWLELACWFLRRFLAHLSWKLKWAILIAFCLSSVCLSVNFYIFDFFSRTAGPILTKLGTNHPWGTGFKFVQMKGIVPHQGEIIVKQ
jgi:hypothetical protein